MDVGVRELKEHLSAYLDRAAAGEQIRVTDRGRPRVLIVPLPGGDGLERGIAEGWITAPMVSGPVPPAPARVRAAVTTGDMLDDDRGE